MTVKARCLKCKKQFDAEDWKDGETPPCPVCGHPLTISRRKHIKLVVLVVVLILSGLIVGGIILVTNSGDQDAMGYIIISEQDIKAFLQMIERESPPERQLGNLPSWVENCIVIEFPTPGYKPQSLSKFSDLCEAEFEKPVPPSEEPSWMENSSRRVVTQQEVQNPTELTGCLRRAAGKANKGDAGAMFLLGWMYDRGWSAESQAYIWYRKAADKGSTDAMYYLGWMYHDDGRWGLSQPYQAMIYQAMSWYRKAADKGNTDAMYMLGAMYANGEGVQGYRQAANWFRKAAENGKPEAMLILGSMYDEGIGVSRDNTEAYAWLSAATAFGNKNSEKVRDRAAGLLAPSVQLAAQSRASELFKKIQKSMGE